MDAKNKSGDNFTLKYYSLSISPWGSPEITADTEEKHAKESLCVRLVLVLSPTNPLLASVRGRILNQKDRQPDTVTVNLAFQSTDRRS